MLNQGTDCKNKNWIQISLGKATDLSTQKFKKLQPLFRVSGDFVTGTGAYWLCQCDCGNQVVELARELINNKISSCGCLKKELLSQTKSGSLIGKQFGRLTVLERAGSSPSQKALWKCQCECGNTITTTTGNLNSGKTKSCGCLRSEMNHNRLFKDLTGQKFGELTVIERDKNYTNKVYFYCQCSCGNYVSVESQSLRTGHTRTCGCGCGLSLGEQRIMNILKDNNIPFIYNKNYFTDLVLPSGGIGRYDFIILDENNNPIRLIEFDGIQHFKPTSFYLDITPQHNLEYVQKNDQVKNQYALTHHLPLVRIPYTYIDKINLETIMGDKFLV